jgi:hypothetical protein
MSTVAKHIDGAPRAIGEKRPAMLKADLPKREKRDMWAEIGGCLDVHKRCGVIALAKLAQCAVETVVTIRRRA